MANKGPNEQYGTEEAEDDRAKRIAAAAERALAEAAERHAQAEQDAQRTAVELGGRDGPEPTRFGDWEKKGIAIDF